MRILFYLPVVSPWWFANIVVGVIRAVARDYEVHVIIPPLWQGTGISKAEAPHIEALPDVHWHLLNGPDHPRLRIDASDQDDLIQFVETLAPDLTLCRSADMNTPARFPGAVLFLMEGGAPPFNLANESLVLKPALFGHGFMPQTDPALCARMDEMADELWNDMLARRTLPAHDVFFSDAGAGAGQRLIGLPLEYEHPENFFGQHHAFANNAAMLREVASQIGDDAVMLVTHHPLTQLHGDVSDVNTAIGEIGGRVKLLPHSSEYDATQAMARHCDGIVVGNSKSWSICAAFGTPMVRLSSAPTASWVNAYNDVASLMADLDTGTAKSADPASAKQWFAHHILNSVFDPLAPTLRADEVIARATRTSDPERWNEALARYRALNPVSKPLQEASYA